jgi:hypothetical protein
MILSPADLQQIKDIFYAVYREELPNEITNATIADDTLPKITEIVNRYYDLSQQHLKHAFRLISPIPCQIHSDYGHDDSDSDINPSIVILIPFQSDSHTIVFNQECLTHFRDYKLTHSPLVDNGIDPVRDGLTHIDPANLAYVSIKSKEKWEEGKLIVFDRKLLHCSDDFKATVAKKEAAVLWYSYR